MDLEKNSQPQSLQKLEIGNFKHLLGQINNLGPKQSLKTKKQKRDRPGKFHSKSASRGKRLRLKAVPEQKLIFVLDPFLQKPGGQFPKCGRR